MRIRPALCCIRAPCVDSRGLRMEQRGRRTAVGRLQSLPGPRRVLQSGRRLFLGRRRLLQRGLQSSQRVGGASSGAFRKALAAVWFPLALCGSLVFVLQAMQRKAVLRGRVQASRAGVREKPGRDGSPPPGRRLLTRHPRRISTLRPPACPAEPNHGSTTRSSPCRHPVLDSLPTRITFRRPADPAGQRPCQKRANFYSSSNFPWFGQMDSSLDARKAMQVALPTTTLCIDGH